ncbi:tripartite tricarboxylate transporter substrate binding protein [Burkholderiaceae bacterium FT117]|uniref:Bug family tripartite tricarboxylate transporter substrate binding protein n=1 Tax=Zeimonas sediminis TaxID=2944268 RepID=UPI002342FB79|nr:tripartite tricarboxylate transporter substrate binding protein [Zeimonas sediminis]MCM5570188.1 tripartite tricarboxylate transporter substrate binding protein [Zeimonas sediminis]
MSNQIDRAPVRAGHPVRRALSRAVAAGALGLALAGAAPFAAAPAAAQEWPTKPIRFVIPYPPGGPLDLVGRALAEALREPLGQPVVVENRPGAGGNLGADNVAKSAPDGYSIVMGAVATHAINPYLYAKMPYDANRDFAPITRVAMVPNVLVMNPDTAKDLGIGSVADLIAYARKNPGKLNYASGGNGSAGHLAGELLKAQAKVSMVHIPYRGAAPAQLGLLAGQTDLMFDNLASAAPQIRAGKLKAFAVTTPQRSGFFAELPTVAESGLPGFDISTWFGVFAPAGTPPAIVDKLNAAFGKALGSPEIRERLAKLAAEPAPMSPADFAAFIRAEQAKYEKVVRASGARVD